MDQSGLRTGCEETARLAQEALTWVEEPKNDVALVTSVPTLRERCVTRLIKPKGCGFRGRPMSVGVFGPSQAGKSYLVSVLARKESGLVALFDDPARPQVDFIADINPPGGKESTGLVTRFTIHKTATPANFPVTLRLLSQTDLLKILANSYYFDTNLQDEKEITPEDVDAHIAKLQVRASTSYSDVLREEDIWDVEEYFLRPIKRNENKVFTGFWDRFARLAPYLPINERAELFSIFWGFHKPFTDLYRRLLENLARLQFAATVFCKIDALVPQLPASLT